MRHVIRTLAVTAAAAAIAGSLAGPAAASPEDGQGCVGTPTIPLTYVCVISLNPTAVAPTVTTTPLPVTVPPVCYYAGCTAPTTVNVPVPSAGEGGGNVVVLWHNGVYYPIGIESDGVVTLLVEAVDTTLDTAGYYAGVLVAIAGETYATAEAEVDAALTGISKTTYRYLQLVLGLVDDPASACERAFDLVDTLPYDPAFYIAC